MTQALKLPGVPANAVDTVIVAECAPDQAKDDREKPPGVAARSFLLPLPPRLMIDSHLSRL